MLFTPSDQMFLDLNLTGLDRESCLFMYRTLRALFYLRGFSPFPEPKWRVLSVPTLSCLVIAGQDRKYLFLHA